MRNHATKDLTVKKRGRKMEDLSGRRYGSWTITSQHRSEIRPPDSKKVSWLALCDCGTTRWVLANSLLRERSTGCNTCSQRRRRREEEAP
jgi:hypothetical protein